ncbi:hypothetical protein BB561_001269 [Smittium simulii]|uniref:Uncharacterized protein n=1 Tax=Smittium simulii TaxID=133385 RepID=A0A2T9YVE5_9FUNG|nr:hypothetical protein BB561_001269 [Smittium simulii]
MLKIILQRRIVCNFCCRPIADPLPTSIQAEDKSRGQQCDLQGTNSLLSQRRRKAYVWPWTPESSTALPPKGIYTHSYSPEVQEIPEICMERKEVSVQGTPFRFIIESMDFHKKFKTRSKMGKKKKNLAINIPRQFFYSEKAVRRM